VYKRQILCDARGAQARAHAARAAAITRFAWRTAAQAIDRVYEKALL